jgi:adenine nucleotide transporter 17
MLIINPIINTFVYELLKTHLLPHFHLDNDEIVFFISGASSKFVATIVTYPYQMLRTKKIQNGALSYTDLTSTIIHSSGFLGLYVGLSAKIYQTVLNQAFLLTFYEKILAFQTYLIYGNWILNDHINDFFMKLILMLVIVLL